MISVVICSINKDFAQQVQKSIEASIGVAWEFIAIDNTQSPQSLTKVYNLGASRAQYDILCFVHEDIVFKTQNWGVKLLEYFAKDSSLGLVGVGGSKYKSKTPSGWYSGFSELDCCNITHRNTASQEHKIYFNPVPGSLTQPVVVADGVFLCCPKKVWQEIKFNDSLLKDFHLYDLDFSLRVAGKFKVIVTFEIDIIHITKGGHYGNKWLEETLLWHRERKGELPVYTPDLGLPIEKIEKKILGTWLIRLKHESISFENKLRWLYDIKIWKQIAAWPYIVLFLAKGLFRKRR